MIDIWYLLVQAVCPWDWARYAFMKNALLAVLMIAPVFALLGTLVVNNRMAFFSDVLGHSALTGVAIGVVLGFADPFWPMLIFAVLLAAAFNFLKKLTKAGADTILGVFLSFVTALGIVLLSRGGGFAKFTSYLIGDILAVSAADTAWLGVLFFIVWVYWFLFSSRLAFSSVSPVLARSRGVNVFYLEMGFTMLIAVVVASSIRLVGILMINALLILPAAASRNFARNMAGYTAGAVVISLISGIAGLIASYYWATASGATIVLFAVMFYAIAALLSAKR
ncbi:MAG: metal ABC transporter permease [Candidatus Omnitrophica bacterium]|nr:metal ABC transporter permease [Candidatus Omnitrophota bacterium]